MPLNLWYRFVFDDGEKFDYSGNDQSMQNEIEKFSKNDFSGFKKLISFTEKIFNKGFDQSFIFLFASKVLSLEILKYSPEEIC